MNIAHLGPSIPDLQNNGVKFKDEKNIVITFIGVGQFNVDYYLGEIVVDLGVYPDVA